MAALDYYVTADPSWGLLQLENVSLTYDTTLVDADVYLPQLSTITAKNVQIQINNIGGGVVNLIPFADGAAVPPVQDTISGATSFEFTGDGVFYTLRINSIDGVAIDWAIEQALSVSVGAANQASFATPTYVNYPIGFVVYIKNYNATGEGCSVQKTSAAAGTFLDWIVTATELTASTGGFGDTPA